MVCIIFEVWWHETKWFYCDLTWFSFKLHNLISKPLVASLQKRPWGTLAAWNLNIYTIDYIDSIISDFRHIHTSKSNIILSVKGDILSVQWSIFWGASWWSSTCLEEILDFDSNPKAGYAVQAIPYIEAWTRGDFSCVCCCLFVVWIILNAKKATFCNKMFLLLVPTWMISLPWMSFFECRCTPTYVIERVRFGSGILGLAD